MSSSSTPSYELVLFDLDGVIIDSRENMRSAWSAVQDQIGVTEPFESYFSLIGRPFREILGLLGLSDAGDAIAEVYERVSAETIGAVPIFPSVVEVLDILVSHKRKVGIVTSKDADRTRLVLDRIPVTFSVVMNPQTGLRGKPAPDMLLYAIATLNIDPRNALFVGDMDTDAQAAERAGIDYAHADWGYGGAPAYTNHLLRRPEDLLVVPKTGAPVDLCP